MNYGDDIGTFTLTTIVSEFNDRGGGLYINNYPKGIPANAVWSVKNYVFIPKTTTSIRYQQFPNSSRDNKFQRKKITEVDVPTKSTTTTPTTTSPIVTPIVEVPSPLPIQPEEPSKSRKRKAKCPVDCPTGRCCQSCWEKKQKRDFVKQIKKSKIVQVDGPSDEKDEEEKMEVKTLEKILKPSLQNDINNPDYIAGTPGFGGGDADHPFWTALCPTYGAGSTSTDPVLVQTVNYSNGSSPCQCRITNTIGDPVVAVVTHGDDLECTIISSIELPISGTVTVENTAGNPVNGDVHVNNTTQDPVQVRVTNSPTDPVYNNGNSWITNWPVQTHTIIDNPEINPVKVAGNVVVDNTSSNPIPCNIENAVSINSTPTNPVYVSVSEAITNGVVPNQNTEANPAWVVASPPGLDVNVTNASLDVVATVNNTTSNPIPVTFTIGDDCSNPLRTILCPGSSLDTVTTLSSITNTVNTQIINTDQFPANVQLANELGQTCGTPLYTTICGTITAVFEAHKVFFQVSLTNVLEPVQFGNGQQTALLLVDAVEINDSVPPQNIVHWYSKDQVLKRGLPYHVGASWHMEVRDELNQPLALLEDYDLQIEVTVYEQARTTNLAYPLGAQSAKQRPTFA